MLRLCGCRGRTTLLWHDTGHKNSASKPAIFVVGMVYMALLRNILMEMMHCDAFIENKPDGLDFYVIFMTHIRDVDGLFTVPDFACHKTHFSVSKNLLQPNWIILLNFLSNSPRSLLQ